MENKVIKTIKTRVSCRAYSEKKVPFSKVMAVAEAGKYAPSGKNRQIANIFVVKSKRSVERLRKLSLDVLDRDCMYGAKTILLVTGPQDDPFTFQDCSCVLENMFVVASMSHCPRKLVTTNACCTRAARGCDVTTVNDECPEKL